MRWKPAVSFDKCYLSVYPGKNKLVYLTREVYALMGRPRKLVVHPIGSKVVLSPSRKYGTDVMFGVGGQPYIVCPEASRIIGPGNRAYYSYDEEDYDERWIKRHYFYFCVRRN